MNWTRSTAILLLALLGNFPSLAQDAAPVGQDDGPMPIENLDQADELGQTNESGQVIESGDTNKISEKGESNQTNGSGRRRRGPYRRGSFRTNAPSAEVSSSPANDRAASGSATDSDRGPVRPAYEQFKIVTERNIFDPNRAPNRGFVPRAAPTVTHSFTLVGTMSYEKGMFAFFDGTSPEYRKAVKRADTIATYTITGITPNSVQLSSGTNQVELRVGMQMRRSDQDQWIASGTSQTLAATPGSVTAAIPSSESGGAKADTSTIEESDVLKRLRLRREQK